MPPGLFGIRPPRRAVCGQLLQITVAKRQVFVQFDVVQISAAEMMHGYPCDERHEMLHFDNWGVLDGTQPV